jgi:hypothetical protein
MKAKLLAGGKVLGGRGRGGNLLPKKVPSRQKLKKSFPPRPYSKNLNRE